jgi:hypothetical protein
MSADRAPSPSAPLPHSTRYPIVGGGLSRRRMREQHDEAGPIGEEPAEIDESREPAAKV